MAEGYQGEIAKLRIYERHTEANRLARDRYSARVPTGWTRTVRSSSGARVAPLDSAHSGSVHLRKIRGTPLRTGRRKAYFGRTRPHGFDNLRVCDASVFPNIVAGNLNAPAMMMGWKGAELILK